MSPVCDPQDSGERHSHILQVWEYRTIYHKIKHIDKIFGDTFMMQKNIQLAIHFLDKDMIRNFFNYNQTKTGICKSNMATEQEKICVEIGKIKRIATKMVPDLEDLTYEER